MPLDDDAAAAAPTDGPLPDVDPAALSSYARRDELTELRRAFDLLAAPAGSPAPPRAGGGRGATLAAAAITPASLAAFAARAGWTPPPAWADDAVWEADDDADGVVAWAELRAAAARARGPAAAAEPRALADVAAFAAAADPVTWRVTGDAAAAGAHLRVGRGAGLAAALADFLPAAATADGDDDAASLVAALPVSLSLEAYMAAAGRAQARAIKALPGGGGGGGGRVPTTMAPARAGGAGRPGGRGRAGKA